MLVARGDPDRWRAAMTAPPERRPGLMALYAFNLEIARAPWVASEPMLAEIRLRWWHDAVAEIYEGAAPRRHEVVGPLAEAIRGGELPRGPFEETIAARMADATPAPLPDRAALDAYLAQTAGHLMELAARYLGAPEAAWPAIRDFGYGAGVASLLRALPALRARGHETLPPGTDVAALARDGLVSIARARAARALVPHEAAPALLAGWRAEGVLKRAAADPQSVAAGVLEVSELRARAALLWRGSSGRW